jgi:hypothetical protein
MMQTYVLWDYFQILYCTFVPYLPGEKCISSAILKRDPHSKTLQDPSMQRT